MSDFEAKCSEFHLAWGHASDSAGGAYSTPTDSLAGFPGPTSKGQVQGTGGEGRKGDWPPTF